MNLSMKLFLIIFRVLIIIYIFTNPLITEAYSSSVEFIVDFSESMDMKIGDKSKIDIAREILIGIIDNLKEPVDAGLTFYGHRYKDKCDDVELVVLIKGLDKEAMKKRLSETRPKGKAPIALALKTAAERLKDSEDYGSVVLITDGEMTCKGDLIKIAREIKEKYDFRMILHVIGLNPRKNNRIELVRLAHAGYGTYHDIRNKKDIGETIEKIVEKINNPYIHHPKVVNLNEMVLIPAGKFLMGSGTLEDDPNEHPRHTVYLDAFYIDKYEVTQQQFKSVMGYNPSFWIGSDLPVDSVSWFEAKEFCEKAGKKLPTEAEWEKAAKGGRDDRWPGTNIKEDIGKYAWIDDMIVDISNRSGSRTHPVGQKKPNGYGIYDMAGNVWEWVADWFSMGYYKISPENNPKGSDKGVVRVLRGGCWDNHWIEVRTTIRYGLPPEVKYANNGFRCAKSAE
ncbi:MAG: VWA domain-containing protein [Nitrospira sp.]|nr:VWA domain-containing protein [Nitrospira sp.]